MNRFWIFIKELYLKQKWIFVFLFMVPFINDRYYGIIPKEQMDYLKIVSFISIIVLFVAKKKKPSIIFMSLFLLETWWLISTVVNYGMSDAMYTTLREIISVLSITLIIEFFIIDPNQLLNGLMLNYELAIYPNFIYVVLSYMTGSRYYILGYYTSLILWFLPATCVSALYIIIYPSIYFRRYS